MGERQVGQRVRGAAQGRIGVGAVEGQFDGVSHQEADERGDDGHR